MQNRNLTHTHKTDKTQNKPTKQKKQQTRAKIGREKKKKEQFSGIPHCKGACWLFHPLGKASASPRPSPVL